MLTGKMLYFSVKRGRIVDIIENYVKLKNVYRQFNTGDIL